MNRAAVVGVGAVGPWGLGTPPAEAYGFRIPEPFAFPDAAGPKERRLMSQGARLGAIALREALASAGWHEDRESIGCYLGVGASGARMEEIPQALAASLENGAFSEGAFGERGIHACNPLFVFQLLHNFSLCHGAIQEGLGGPNGAFFSRGAGTGAALAEALAALAEGTCERLLAGGADSAHHPVTLAELRREGGDLVPSEGAAVLALVSHAASPRTWISLADPWAGKPEAVVAAGPKQLAERARAHWPQAELRLWPHGEALAATPALAWACAVDLPFRFIRVLTQGPDGELLAVDLEHP